MLWRWLFVVVAWKTSLCIKEGFFPFNNSHIWCYFSCSLAVDDSISIIYVVFLFWRSVYATLHSSVLFEQTCGILRHDRRKSVKYCCMADGGKVHIRFSLYSICSAVWSIWKLLSFGRDFCDSSKNLLVKMTEVTSEITRLTRCGAVSGRYHLPHWRRTSVEVFAGHLHTGGQLLTDLDIPTIPVIPVY